MKRGTWIGLLLTLLLAIAVDAAKLSWTVENALGEPQDGLVLQLKAAGTSTVVASTASGTVVDNGDGSYITSGDLPSGEYSVYSGSGSGTLIPALAYVAHIDPDDLTAVRPISQGGTGAATAAGARYALDLEPGVDFIAYTTARQAWALYLDGIGTPASNAWTYKNTSGAWVTASASDMRTALSLAPGVHVQAYDADLTTLGAGGSGARTFLGLAIGSQVQAWDAALDQLVAAPGGISGQDGFIINADGSGIEAALPATARTMLGLGTAAVINATDTGASGDIARFTSDSGGGGLVFPTRTTHLAATAGNLGKTYFMSSGNATTGSWGLYTIERNSNTIAYTYAVRAIVERTW